MVFPQYLAPFLFFMRNLPDLLGKKINMLTVVKCVGADKYKKRRWMCICDCGNYKEMAEDTLKRGKGKSCGCLKKTFLKTSKTTHGMSFKTEYFIWAGMKARCYNHNHIGFSFYGGKGIKVCDRWLNSFSNFYADMGNRPSKNHSLDRYPNKNGNYDPSNCRWATRKEQANNRINNTYLEINGIKKTTKEWTGIYKIPYETFLRRRKIGWDINKALSHPIQKRKNNIN